MSRKPTPAELFERMLEPFDDEIDEALSMTPEEIRASLAADGYDVAAIERDARAFLRLDKPRINPARLACFIAPFAFVSGLIEVCGPAAPAALPVLANATASPPAVTGAAPPVPAPDGIDGGKR
jgi:hypothetical protein